MSAVETRDGVDNLRVLDEALKRRTIAVISHPDAGKSTLTEALLLHAHAIGEAGATHGKAGRRATVSDWMTMEKERGISISSAAIQFTHRDTIINLVDTPGHADFSEDTYRVLAAVDAAIMLVDAAKGLEAQTMKLFEVCKRRGIPLITMINKWDRPGGDALALMDEIEKRTGLFPTPLTWPVGESGDFRGLVDCDSGLFVRFHRTAGGATIASEETVPAEDATAIAGPAWQTAVEETGLLREEGHRHDESLFLSAASTPVLFGAAALNIGVRQLLDTLVDLAPSAEARADTAGVRRAVNSDFSGFVFKVQSGMDSNHRDRVAFVRVCSGVFERGMTVTHEPSGRPFATKYAQQMFGKDRETVDMAWPGDIVGLINASALRPGDTLFTGGPVVYPPMPRFQPEHFRAVRSTDSSKHKQFRKGIEQLDHEGVIQVLHSDRRGDQTPILAAVGPMQFEVAAERMANEYRAPIAFDALPYTVACLIDAETAKVLAKHSSIEVTMASDGRMIALFANEWKLRTLRREHPELTLDSVSAE